MEGGEHGDFELDGVPARGSEGDPFIGRPFGDLDRVVHIVLDAVHSRVEVHFTRRLRIVACSFLRGLVQPVPNWSDFEHAGFFEGPGC